jgi:hypothetical protein
MEKTSCFHFLESLVLGFVLCNVKFWTCGSMELHFVMNKILTKFIIWFFIKDPMMITIVTINSTLFGLSETEGFPFEIFCSSFDSC